MLTTTTMTMVGAPSGTDCWITNIWNDKEGVLDSGAAIPLTYNNTTIHRHKTFATCFSTVVSAATPSGTPNLKLLFQLFFRYGSFTDFEDAFVSWHSVVVDLVDDV
jgi:hypothetical protein